MEMTPATAGLMAQVIPTLLIVVALEPRLRGVDLKGMELTRYGRFITGLGRELAVASSLIAVAFCLWVVFTNQPLPFATVYVIGATVWLLSVLFLLFAFMFGVEQRERRLAEDG